MISSGWMQEMEPIPEEGTEADGSEWGATSDGGTGKRTMRKKEVYTSEQINTLVRKMSDDEFFSEPREVEVENKESKTRKSYSLEFKKKVVRAARSGNISKASRIFNVSRQCIQEWMKRRSEISDEVERSGGKKKRLDGGGRPVGDKEFDDELLNWIKNLRKENKRVSRRIIQRKAQEMSKCDTFMASNGWLESFLKRHHLTTRRATTVCQRPPSDYQEKIVNFFLFVEKQRRNHKYDHIYACDETAVYLDNSNTLTVDEKGARQVSVHTTGHDKMHITVMLCAREDGYKCRPFVLLPNKRPIPVIVEKYGKKLELCWEGRTFFNDATTSNFLQKVLGTSLFGKRLLVWDSYRCHISAETKKKLKQLRLETAVIPGGTTKFIQAPDVFWNSPFKAKIRQQYEDWMIHGEKSLTAAGNMRAPPMDVYLGWICEAWNFLSSELIIKSFRGCGLGPNLDGEDDDCIQCFKKGGEMPEGLLLLKKRRDDAAEKEICDLIDEVEIEGDENEEEREDDPNFSDASVEFE
ncbi:hypothetical protein CRE_26893 [Caenorhabditis remanei]|uniref:HTH CENPB-type domain-containing protein n=1 Tax=Caenorhabditis remanei TaxID=31234 RepID=E3NS64_CAERE|nr:hypothetical protein CRE_26893 [Caenorhabditis remanei]